MRFLASLFVLSFCQSLLAMEPKDQPVEFFSSLPSSSYRLSPSASKVGFFMPINGRRHLIVQNLDGSGALSLPPWDDKLELVSFFWKTEDVVIFRIHMTLDRTAFRSRTTETRLISYNISNNNVKWLGQPKRGAFGKNTDDYSSQFEWIVDRLIDQPDHVLVQLDFELDGYPSLYRINVHTGSRKLVHKQRTGTNHWFVDAEGVIRLGQGYKVRGSKEMYRYRLADGKWRDLVNYELLEDFELDDLGSEVGEVYMTGTNEHGTSSMYRVDLLKGEILETLFEHTEVDIDSTVRHPATDKIVGVEYIDDFYREKYFDRDMLTVQRSLEKVLPGLVVNITDKARDANVYLVLASSDVDPGQYYLFDRDAGRLDYFASYREQIDPELSAATKRVDIPVSDGTTIPAYLTLPKGAGSGPLPTIVLPHGGPHARDSADWDYEAQFYASRGYVVLKPNFRGSTGYGRAYLEKGRHQWGGLMQQDLTDATHWLIQQKIADPEKICIVGGSYGGYAAMMGLIQQPGLYACGISVNGVMNLPALKTADRDIIGGRSWIQHMGLEGVDDTEVSPQHQAERISAPVLLVAATNDARVAYKQSRNLHKTLQKLNKPSTYVELDTGTHYMLNSEARLATLKAAEQFLATHLGSTPNQTALD